PDDAPTLPSSGGGGRKTDGLAAERDGAPVFEQQRAQAPADPVRLRLDQRLLADEVDRLAQAHRESKAGFVGVVLRRDVGAPDAVALLQPHRIDGAVAARDQPERRARLPECVPQFEPSVDGAVKLPAELAD